jgi:hypothetical protein
MLPNNRSRPRSELTTADRGRPRSTPAIEEVADELRRALERVRHGSITLIVQDGRVVQIDTTTKLRLAPGSRGG